MFFSENYEDYSPEQLLSALKKRVAQAQLRRMIVTMGDQGAVYIQPDGPSGICPPQKVDVIDTTGAGDCFFAGVAIGLTYGKSLAEACRIGTRLAASVISTRESVCPRFLPEEFDLTLPGDHS